MSGLRLVAPQPLRPANPRRWNLGCGDYPLEGYTNVDADPACPAHWHGQVPPLPAEDASLDEIYIGHMLEHLTPEDAATLLAECARCLVAGGQLGVVVPDTRAIMATWLGGVPMRVEYPPGVYHDLRDLNHVNRLFLYSTMQDSHHLWAYDLHSVGQVIMAAGFTLTREIDRFQDPRISVGAWYQCGWDAVKP